MHIERQTRSLGGSSNDSAHIANDIARPVRSRTHLLQALLAEVALAGQRGIRDLDFYPNAIHVLPI